MTPVTWVCAVVSVLSIGLLTGLLLYGLNDVYAIPTDEKDQT